MHILKTVYLVNFFHLKLWVSVAFWLSHLLLIFLGMAIFDTMRHIRPDVSTVCVGLAARYEIQCRISPLPPISPACLSNY